MTEERKIEPSGTGLAWILDLLDNALVEVDKHITDIRLLGIIGAILMIIIPPIGGIILMLVVHKISRDLNRLAIFRNYFVFILLYAIIAYFLGGDILGVLVRGALFSLPGIGAEAVLSVVLFIIAWILTIISALFLRKSYGELSTVMNMKQFMSVARLFFYGSVLIIALGVGYILILIAMILQVIAYWKFPRQLVLQPTA